MILLVILLMGLPVFARDKSTVELEKSGELHIPFQDCATIENKIGQLFYANVDGFGAEPIGKVGIAPAYIRMVKDLQLGGVLPHMGSFDVQTMRRDIGELRKATDLPLMIGIDFFVASKLSLTPPVFDVVQGQPVSQAGFNRYSASDGIRFGMGYGSGFIDLNGNKSNECFSRGAYIDAFLHRYFGLNQSLGPTVENRATTAFLKEEPEVVLPKVNSTLAAFNEMGIVTTMKHFPYTPIEYNLHDRSEDTKIPLAKVKEMLRIYKEIGNGTDFAMTTHLLNSNVDPDEMATFSEKWIGILRNDLGFNGILMTDALFMISKYEDSIKMMAAKWPQDQIAISDEHTIFAARAILAGHDMVYMEGTSTNTYNIFQNMMKIACSGKPIGEALRKRIDVSYTRIVDWKKAHREELQQNQDIPMELFDEAHDLYNQHCPDPERFQKFKDKVTELKILPLRSKKIRMSKDETIQ